jgi:hypothetical protein
MVAVIGASSGANGVIERMRRWVAGEFIGKSLAAVINDLQQVAALGAGLAMPLLMVNAARGAYESAFDPELEQGTTWPSPDSLGKCWRVSHLMILAGASIGRAR